MTIVEMKPEGTPSPASKLDAAPPPAATVASVANIASPANDAGSASAGGTASAGSTGVKMATTVAEIVPGVRDSGGEMIDCVYFKRDEYAIYRRGTPPQVVVAYADDDRIADQQIAAMSGLLPLRDHLIHLIADFPDKSQEAYRAHVADALRLALQKQNDTAKALLTDCIDDAVAAQARTGRLVYLKWAGWALVPALALILIGGYFVQNRAGVHLLLMSAGAGAVGAFLSIAIAIRARSVAIEGDWKANAMDAWLRVAIGMISSCILFLLLNSGVVTTITAGTVQLTGAEMQWQVALIIGFAAGFLERLVPDLLEKSAPDRPPAATPLGAGAGGVATPPGNA